MIQGVYFGLRGLCKAFGDEICPLLPPANGTARFLC